MFRNSQPPPSRATDAESRQAEVDQQNAEYQEYLDGPNDDERVDSLNVISDAQVGDAVGLISTYFDDDAFLADDTETYFYTGENVRLGYGDDSYTGDNVRLGYGEAQAVDTVVGSTSGAVGRSVSTLSAAGTTCVIVMVAVMTLAM